MINVRDKFCIIRELSCKYTVKLLCDIAGVSRSGYYKWLNKGNIDISYSELENKILELYNKSKKVYGYRRIKVALLREFGIRVNHKKILRLMRKINIKSVIRKKKFKYKKLKIEYCSTKENILNRNFKAEKINEKWATDITYLFYGDGKKKAYLSAIKDLFNNEIVAYKVSKHLDLSFVLETVNTAVKRNKNSINGLILHSDQGTHYTSKTYQALLSKHGIIQSMSRRGNCLDNACIENFFGYLKSELIYQNSYQTFEELSDSIAEYIHWYNTERFQGKLNNRTPIEFRCAA